MILWSRYSVKRTKETLRFKKGKEGEVVEEGEAIRVDKPISKQPI